MRLFIIIFTSMLVTAIASSTRLLGSGQDEKRIAELDTEHVIGNYLGFGIGIHGGDVIYPKAFDELMPRYIRMEFGPRWDTLEEKIPSATSVEQYFAYIERNYNADAHDRLEGARYTHNFLRERDIEIIKIHFNLPYHWRTQDEASRLLSKHIEDLARFHTAHLIYLRQHDVHIDYIELANEPDGFWNGHIEAKDYAQLVKRCDQLFEEHALTDVKILGPGLTFLNLHNWSPPYFDELEKIGVHHLDGWSTHTWDEAEFTASFPEYTYGVWKPFLTRIQELDPKGQMPTFVTEYASDITQFNGKQWASPRDQVSDTIVDTWHNAVRVIANSITHLNRGADALVLYRLSNSHWHDTGWGIIQPETGSEYTPKPVYKALAMSLSKLPINTQALEPTWYSHNDPIILSCLHEVDKKRIHILATNWTETKQTKRISLAPILDSLRLLEIETLESKGLSNASGISIKEGYLNLEQPALSITRMSFSYTDKK